MSKTMQIHAVLKTLALAGLLAFVATPAMAATTTAPATPSATAPATPNAALPTTPTGIDDQGAQTPEINEVEAADDVSSISDHEVETPDVADVGTPEVDTPQVNVPEDQ